MKRDVVVVDKKLLDEILEVKKAGFSKTEIKTREGNGYKIAKLSDVKFHKSSKKNRTQNAKEFAAQLQSMAELGQIEPVKLFRGALVDGRHRYWALKDLGIEYIKYVDLPYDTTLDGLEAIAEGTEVRRADTPAQKAAKAYMDYMQNSKAEDANTRYYATKHATTHGSISKMGKIADKLGNDVVKAIYQKGETFVNGKRYNSISPLYQLALSMGTEPTLGGTGGLQDIPEDVLDVFKIINAFKKKDELTKIAAVKTYCTKAIDELNRE